jgi:hypothetical protein
MLCLHICVNDGNTFLNRCGIFLTKLLDITFQNSINIICMEMILSIPVNLNVTSDVNSLHEVQSIVSCSFKYWEEIVLNVSSSEHYKVWNIWLDCYQSLTAEVYVVVLWVKTLCYLTCGCGNSGTVRCLHHRGGIFGTFLAGKLGSRAISFGFISTRTSDPTSESPSGETQTLRQSPCSEKLKSCLRATATRNSNPTSESTPLETGIVLTFIL